MYSEFFSDITGVVPYKYQLKVAEHLFNGKNIILSVPTGAGKTWASITPFLFAQHKKLFDFPQKMIYSLPLRTLTNSIYSDINNALKKNPKWQDLTSIQTGEYKNDEHFESDIIFSTIDQTLSNFLCFPLSLSKRQANINAGALVGSYLVFDEFHLLDPKLSMSTTLGVLRILDHLCRFCIMTATLSKEYINELKNIINAEIVSIDDFPDDTVKINSLKVPEGRAGKKMVIVQENTINAESILKNHRNKSIVICNRVEKAQEVYNEIMESNFEGFENLQKLAKSNIICLHSRFFDEDRKKKEDDLKRIFGNRNDESAILISTQVIEAGMDISCDTMHVEISPINSFLQRAGRCARWENEFGEIYVYNILELDEKEQLKIETDIKEELAQIRAINNKYLPYDKSLCEITFERLKGISTLDKDIPQKLVDDILTLQELKDYSLIKQDNFNSSKIQESWETCEKNMYAQTIRDIQSIEVAIIDYAREQRSAFMPYKYQTIGLYKWSFIKWAKEILNKRDFDIDDDVIFTARKNSESTIIDIDTNDLDSYSLDVVRNVELLKNCYDIVFVDKSIFKYTPDAGLELGVGKTCSPLNSYEKKEKGIIEYRKDTFWQHNKAIIGCYEQKFKPKLQFAFQQLDNYWGESIDWDKLIKAMICLHDYGKLNSAWQKPMRELQILKGNYVSGEVLAHSDFNELTDKEIERQSGAKQKPPHAGAGAYVFVESAVDLINSATYEDLANSVSTAILKHHGVETETYSNFDITEKNYNEIERLLGDIGIKIKLTQKARGGKLTDYLPDNKEEWIMYLFFVRILRLCDQKATMNFETYLKQ
jgi:CRISPR-associated endonuclease/helicase Cas3